MLFDEYKKYGNIKEWETVEDIDEGIDEGISSTFKKIIQATEEIVNVRYFKEKIIDGVKTLFMKIESSLYPEDIDKLEDDFPHYFFDQDKKHQIIQVHEE